jgi:hypothetical protein
VVTTWPGLFTASACTVPAIGCGNGRVIQPRLRARQFLLKILGIALGFSRQFLAVLGQEDLFAVLSISRAKTSAAASASRSWPRRSTSTVW